MKHIIINSEHLQTRIAIVENGIIQEYYTETGKGSNIVGSIYKGKITNLESSLQAAFIDIGLEKNAFLHYWDMVPATKDAWENESIDDDYAVDPDVSEQESPDDEKSANPRSDGSNILQNILSFIRPRKPPRNDEPARNTESKPEKRRRRRRRPPPEKKITSADIADIPKKFKVDSDVIVQVTKGAIGTKGPRVTTNLSIPGRYVVLLPNSSHRGVSKRIEDRQERNRLRELLGKVRLPNRMGLICRTASTGLDVRLLQTDIDMLVGIWRKALSDYKSRKAPWNLYQEPNLMEKTIRDCLSDDLDEIVVDSKESYNLVMSYLKELNGKDLARYNIKLYNNPKPIFQSYNLKEQINSIFNRTISLPSGAELCIDETEALIAIDVNSKKSRGGKDHPETILRTNLEAADEIGRQLRLRNIGGLVIIDFIDMRSRDDRYAVYQKMREILYRDRARTKILPISKLGLMEMTRQREYESLQDSTFRTCEYCEGRGLIKSSEAISVEIQRQLQEILRRNRGVTPVRVTVHPEVLQRLKSEDADILERMEADFGGELTFRSDVNLHHEEFRFTHPKTGRPI